MRKVIEELKQRRDNLDAAIRILEDEMCPEEPEPHREKPERPRKKTEAALDAA